MILKAFFNFFVFEIDFKSGFEIWPVLETILKAVYTAIKHLPLLKSISKSVNKFTVKKKKKNPTCSMPGITTTSKGAYICQDRKQIILMRGEGGGGRGKDTDDFIVIVW